MDYKNCEEYVLGELSLAQNENELLKKENTEMKEEIQSLREEASNLRSEIIKLRDVIKKMSADGKKDILDEADELLKGKGRPDFYGDDDSDKINPYYEYCMMTSSDSSSGSGFTPILIYTDGADLKLNPKGHFHLDNLGEIEVDLSDEKFKEFYDEFMEGYKRNKKRAAPAEKNAPAKKEK